jgi:hypothetical protein
MVDGAGDHEHSAFIEGVRCDQHHGCFYRQNITKTPTAWSLFQELRRLSKPANVLGLFV